MFCSPFPASSGIQGMYIVIPITTVSAIVALFGNCLVVYVIIKRETLSSQPAYKFIGSLAAADILVSAVSQPLYIALLLNKGCWLARIGHFVGSLSSSASALGLLIVSIDRYIYITRPLHYFMIMKPIRIRVALAYIWSCAVAISFLPYLVGMEIFHAVLLAATIFNYFVIGYCYVTIYRVVSCRVSGDSVEVQNKDRRQRQATRTIAFVVFAMVICWLPYIVVSFIWSLDVSYYQPSSTIISVYFWLVALGHWNSSVNVIIYGWKNKELRSAILSFFGIRINDNMMLSLSITHKNLTCSLKD